MLKKFILGLTLILSIFSFGLSCDATSNSHLNSIGRNNTGEGTEKLVDGNANYGNLKGDSIKNFIIKIAWFVKNAFFIVSGIYFLIIAIRFFFQSGDQEFKNFKNGVIYISLGVVLMQSAYSIAYAFLSPKTEIKTFEGIGTDSGAVKTRISGFFDALIDNLFEPLISVMTVLACVFFIVFAIISFIKIMASNGNSDTMKKGIQSILFAMAGVLLVLVSRRLVEAIYGSYNVKSDNFEFITEESGIDKISNIFISLINRVNGFVGVVTVILIIYSGITILLSGGNPEQLKKGGKTILYAFIGIFILAASWLILTFFVGTEANF